VPELSIVFVNYHSTPYLIKCLQSLEKSTFTDYEVIIIDNNSLNSPFLPTKGLLSLPGRMRVIQSKRNLGYGRALNLGIGLAEGRFIACANPDIFFFPDTLEKLIEFLLANKDTGCVAPQIFSPDNQPQPSARRFPVFSSIFFARRSFLARAFKNSKGREDFLYLKSEKEKAPLAVDSVIGTFVIFRRQALNDVGGFSEAFFLYAEDLDICYRLQQKGWRRFLIPAAKIIHYTGRSRKTNWRFADYHRLKSLAIFYGRYSSFRRFPSLTFLLFFFYFTLTQFLDLFDIREERL